MIDPASTAVPRALWPEGVIYAAECWDGQNYPSNDDFHAAVGKIEEIEDPAIKLQ